MTSAAWTPDRIQQLRRSCEETTAQFGQRFGRSGRAVEDWEQGRRSPDALVQRELSRLAARKDAIR